MQRIWLASETTKEHEGARRSRVELLRVSSRPFVDQTLLDSLNNLARFAIYDRVDDRAVEFGEIPVLAAATADGIDAVVAMDRRGVAAGSEKVIAVEPVGRCRAHAGVAWRRYLSGRFVSAAYAARTLAA